MCECIGLSKWKHCRDACIAVHSLQCLTCALCVCMYCVYTCSFCIQPHHGTCDVASHTKRTCHIRNVFAFVEGKCKWGASKMQRPVEPSWIHFEASDPVAVSCCQLLSVSSHVWTDPAVYFPLLSSMRRSWPQIESWNKLNSTCRRTTCRSSRVSEEWVFRPHWWSINMRKSLTE